MGERGHYVGAFDGIRRQGSRSAHCAVDHTLAQLATRLMTSATYRAAPAGGRHRICSRTTTLGVGF